MDKYCVDGWVSTQVDNGMYGMPQAGWVANDHLIPQLLAAGYKETGRTSGLFCHHTNNIIFVLIVDNFLIQFTTEAALTHLINTLQQHYTITIDRTATKSCGMQLDWEYGEGHVTLSMPGYVEKALNRFTHTASTKPQHAPHPWTPPNYRAQIQYAHDQGDSTPLDNQGIALLQQINGTFLYYAWVINNTMLVPLGTLAASQTKGTEKTMEATIQLLRHAATNPDAAIRFYKSDTTLYAHSNTSYLSEPQARSRVGGFFYLGNSNEPADKPTPNGPVHVESRIMKQIMATTSKAEIGALFLLE